MEHTIELEKLFKNWIQKAPNVIDEIVNNSGSERLYYRIRYDDGTLVGTYNPDIKENKAFLHYSKILREEGIRVPEIYTANATFVYYLLQDLGDTNLLQVLKKEGESLKIEKFYKMALTQLLKMQLFAGKYLDLETYAYPRAAFDSQSIKWDLNYFKYYFLKMSSISFDEQLLENDFEKIVYSISDAKWTGFIHRDFQARNIQIHQNETWFIDYQGGRKGPILYDLVSLLNQASAQLSNSFREKLKIYYRDTLKCYHEVDDIEFEIEFTSLAFIRLIQTLGAYGFRGLIEGKPYFKNSIPMALDNLANLLKSEYLKIEVPYFINILSRILQIKANFISK